MEIELTTRGTSHSLTVVHQGKPVYGYCSRSIERIAAKYRHLLHKFELLKRLRNN